MIIWDSPELVNQFIGSLGGGYSPPGSFQALGWADQKGLLVAGVTFHSSNGVNAFANVAVERKHLQPIFVKACLFYAFRQLKLKRLTFTIAESNLSSQSLARHLGAVHEATLRDAAPDGNMLIFALFPEDCKLWKRFNGLSIRRW